MTGRVALVNLGAAGNVLRDCFRQFSIETVAIEGDPIERLQREKFDAVALRLDESNAEDVLKSLRDSRSNSRAVVYGIASGTQQALKFSRYCVNAVLDEPVERQGALRVVRATHLLVVHEFRRYVRVPIVTEVRIKADGSEVRATTIEVSGGGLSLSTWSKLDLGQLVEVQFTLPGVRQLALRANICWVKAADGQVGVRFEASDEARVHVRKWIDDFIEQN